MNNFRKFRHVVFHGYGFQLDWKTIKQGIEQIEELFKVFKEKIDSFISLEKE